MRVELPFDVWHLVVQSACGPPRTRHRTDLARRILISLCLVSKLLNRVATPFLYSSIALSTKHDVLSLAATSNENPQLLKSCNSLLLLLRIPRCPEVKEAVEDIVSSTAVLHRFMFGSTWASVMPVLGTVSELAYPEQHFYTFPVDNLQTSVNLERLIMASIIFRHSYVVDALIAIPRLTHIAVSKFTPDQIFVNKSGYQTGIIRLLTHTTLKRIVCGWIWENWGSDKFPLNPQSFHKSLLGTAPDNSRVEVVFLMYGAPRGRNMEWFTDRIVDGTVWELDSDTLDY
jgi:hypothetical protein